MPKELCIKFFSKMEEICIILPLHMALKFRPDEVATSDVPNCLIPFFNKPP